ncbi:hypothetical protein [Haematobacter massiliensis]
MVRLTETRVVTLRCHESTGLMPMPRRSAKNYRF